MNFRRLSDQLSSNSVALGRWLLTASLLLLLGCGNDGANGQVTAGSRLSVNLSVGESTAFNESWRYLESDQWQLPNADLPEWQPINLPHTWNATDTVDAEPGYRRAGGWYEKIFVVNEAGHYQLQFEGANTETTLYLNGHEIGEHIGGYVGFTQSLSSHLLVGKPNRLLVRVSNRYNPDVIPSQKADFFIHGGITRDVWLHRLPARYMARVLVSTPNVTAVSADTEVRIQLAGIGAADAQQVRLELTDPQGIAVAEMSKAISAENMDDLVLSLPAVAEPKLWSPSHPHLYRLTVTLASMAGETLQQRVEPVGYRWFEMRDGEGFFLNGKRLLLRGTHRHEEHAGVGAAMTNAQHRADMAQMKALGVNFVRLAHYPQDPEVYRAADELGLILWDELPWCRGGKGGAQWERNTERLLEAQILQNYNHPSIMFWSLGNEIYWESDFPNGGDDAEILPFLKRLHQRAKSLDAHRYTALRKYYPGAEVVDVFSPSIWAGWYGGAYGQYQQALTQAMDKYPHFLHMEYGGSSHRGRHTETPLNETGLPNEQVSVEEAMNQAVATSIAKDSDWNENYMVNLFDWHLSVSEKLPGFGGNAQWAFKDFGTPLRPENPLPYINQKGLVDRRGQPKDAYYVFASYWSDTPFCYIESHTWPVRFGPAEGRPVKVFCNTHSAELSLDGRSLGKKLRRHGHYPAHGLVWQVPFKEGVNHLAATGFDRDGRELAKDSFSLTYHQGEPGKFERVVLSSTAQTADVYLVTAQAEDARGRRAITFSERAYFSTLGGDAELVQDQGTYDGSAIVEMANGVAQIRVRAGSRPSVVEFRTQNVKGVYLTIPARDGAAR